MFNHLTAPTPPDFALRVLHRAGIPADRYDTYVSLPTAAGPLLVATGHGSVTAAVLRRGTPSLDAFETGHRDRTGRSAIRAVRPGIPGLTTAVRTGRARHLPVRLDTVSAVQADILTAVRAVPPGQLRPVGWILSETHRSGISGDDVRAALLHNPASVLIPTHRVTDDLGVPLDTECPGDAAELLRRDEGIDTAEALTLARDGTRFIGSDTTRIFCLPTCAHARRITGPHRVPFGDPADARTAGYRPCKVCRPIAA
ncbi:hypothetical protein CIK06_02430 [Plantactinospora sp. KBS50]|nr:hypothetical protein CIK06_02430 [Plantactinospora sp. KBS50]